MFYTSLIHIIVANMPSIFTKIVNGEIPCHKIYETDNVLAFLDINPVNPGHTLVIPKQEVDDLFDLDKAVYAELMEVVRKVAKAVQKAKNPLRVGLMVLGFDVAHAHVHVIPLQQSGDLMTRRMVNPDLPERGKEELEGDAREVTGAMEA